MVGGESRCKLCSNIDGVGGGGTKGSYSLAQGTLSSCAPRATQASHRSCCRKRKRRRTGRGRGRGCGGLCSGRKSLFVNCFQPPLPDVQPHSRLVAEERASPPDLVLGEGGGAYRMRLGSELTGQNILYIVCAHTCIVCGCVCVCVDTGLLTTGPLLLRLSSHSCLQVGMQVALSFSLIMRSSGRSSIFCSPRRVSLLSMSRLQRYGGKRQLEMKP